MNPSTGTFTTMDTYAGSIFDPTSLHKYLYANANPVTYVDPSGYFGLTDVVCANAIGDMLFYGISAGIINVGLNLIREIRAANKYGTKVDFAYVITMSFVEGFLVGSFFGGCSILASSLNSAIIKTALGGTSFLFVSISLAQSQNDLENHDYDLMVLDIIFATGGFVAAERCFDSAAEISSAKNTAETVTVPTPENTNTAKNSESFTFKESGRKIDISRWHSSENGAWEPLKGGGGKGLGRVAPDQVEPGIRYLEGQYIRDGGNGTGRVEPWKAYYDEYGRLYARTDYNAADPSKGISATHHHLPIWTRGGKYGEKIHYEGEYKP